MQPKIALVLCICGIIGLFAADIRRREQLSSGVWIALLWVLYCGSRPLSYWFDPGLVGALCIDSSEGSALDRTFLSLVILAGLLVLIRRRANWPQILSNNRWVFALFAYMVISVAWSEYPAVSFKRWARTCGDLIIVLELWRQAPERVRGLAFVCSKPQPDAASNYSRRAATIAHAREGKCAALYDGMAQTLIGTTARERHPEVLAQLRARMTLAPEALVAVQAGIATRPDSVPNVASITAPILAIAGGEDPGVTPEEMHAFQAAPGGCDFHLLPEAGHCAAYEQPRKVAALMNVWLRQFEG